MRALRNWYSRHAQFVRDPRSLRGEPLIWGSPLNAIFISYTPEFFEMFQEYSQVVPPNLGEAGITCVEFDPHEELLWTGATNVRTDHY